MVSRDPALDHLRALAMLAGVVFHAALAYSPLLRPWWPAAAPAGSALVDAIAWQLHLVRMPLFFLIAGYLAASLVERRGMAGFARQRARRILLPFLVAWPLVHLTISTATVHAAQTLDQPSPMLRMLREWLAQPDAVAPLPGTGHLWFLYYLLILGVLHWAGRTLGAGAWLEYAARIGLHRLALLLPLALWPAFWLTAAPHPAPEGLLPQFWALALYGAFYAFGVLLHGRTDTLATLRAWLVPGTLLTLAAYALFFHELQFTGAPQLRADAASAALQALVAAWGTLACLIAGQRALAHPRRWLRYLSGSAYWIYLLHLPVLFLIQYRLLDTNWPWPLQFLLSVTLTLAVCLVSYEGLVRRTRLARWVG